MRPANKTSGEGPRISNRSLGWCVHGGTRPWTTSLSIRGERGKIPSGIQGEELVRAYPNHVRGERLLELLSNDWTYTRIIDTMPAADPERRYQLMNALNLRRRLATNERDRLGSPVPAILRVTAGGDLARFKELALAFRSSNSNPPPPPPQS